MNKYLLLAILLAFCNISLADVKTSPNNSMAKKYIDCGASLLRTGLIKTAYNQNSDHESQQLTYVGTTSIIYAGFITTTDTSLKQYIKSDQILAREYSKYYKHGGSRGDIYKYTVNYLVPMNERCLATIKTLGKEISEHQTDFVNFENSDEGKKLISDVVDYAKNNL